jgi:hypothetical protein
MVETLDHASFVDMAVTLRVIWHARHRLLHDGEKQILPSTFNFARRLLDELSQTPPPNVQQKKSVTLIATNRILYFRKSYSRQKKIHRLK